MQTEISDLETRKNVISTKVRSLVVSVHIYVLHDNLKGEFSRNENSVIIYSPSCCFKPVVL